MAAIFYVDIPVKEHFGEDDDWWTNVATFATKAEAVEFIRENIGPCDDDGKIELITEGDDMQSVDVDVLDN